MARWKSDRRLYLTADKSRAVEEGDLEAAYLLCGADCEIDHAEAERLGLVKTKAQAKAPETKQVDHPPENKSRGR